MVPCKSTAEEVSFEWSHHRISATDSKVRTTLHVNVIDSGTKIIKYIQRQNNVSHTLRIIITFYPEIKIILRN